MINELFCQGSNSYYSLLLSPKQDLNRPRQAKILTPTSICRFVTAICSKHAVAQQDVSMLRAER